MKRIIALLVTITLVFCFGTTVTNATDYSFAAKNNDDFYRSSLYEDMYGSAYNYGGPNVTDFYDTSMLPGIISPTPQTAFSSVSTAPAVSADYSLPSNYAADFTSYTTSWDTAFTKISELKRSDGSIGTLYIPSLSISRKAYEGTSAASMDKGVGHFPDTSGWNGNIGLCGHNRGSKYAIGEIKDLEIGDVIEYSTVLGTRRYAVTFVGTISNNDWSYLAATADNRITLVTCLVDQPSLRVCVQAKQIK